ncbi:hypothetical protein [Vagococcus fessus]|uniref:Uncharacterized protein n=1 Tax=Vagococcus fessus TaxID=120370 RepID=A0A430A8U0_9ENTE|nr:hypothetical protein [Vagococcus fessus]RSU03518.1 hypothetical protein CBF31_07340 [Vagococcus fessus]
MKNKKITYLLSTIAALVIGIGGSVYVIRQERLQKKVEQSELKQIEQELQHFEQEPSDMKKWKDLKKLIKEELRYKNRHQVDWRVVEAFEKSIAKEKDYFNSRKLLIEK